MAEMLRGVIAARANCDPKLGTTERCPHCGLFHLRPGYCQALNPKASEAIRSGRALTLEEARELARGPEPALVAETVAAPIETLTETLSGSETVDETLSGSETVDETLSACVKCGKRFKPARASAQFCSPACRLKAHRRRANDGVPAR
jgi:predicted RNA-binding Zn-ribbon protein involved in translation (DUF1610 family)